MEQQSHETYNFKTSEKKLELNQTSPQKEIIKIDQSIDQKISSLLPQKKMRPCTVRQRQMYLRKHPAGFLSNKLPQKVSKKMPMSIASVVLHEKEQEAPKEIPISFPVRLKPDIQVVKVIAKKKNLRNVQTSTGGGVYKLSSSRQQDMSTQLWCRPHLESELKMRKKCDKMVKLEICSYKNNSV